MDEDTIGKLEQAFAFGLPDIQACLYADISKDALYDYQAKNPEFTERKAILKQTVTMHARIRVAKAVASGMFTDDAWKWLEKKERSEFGKDAIEPPQLQVNVVIGLPQLPTNNIPNGTEPDYKPRLLESESL